MSELISRSKPEDKSKSKKKTTKKKEEIIPPLLVIANAQSRRGQKDPTNNPFPDLLNVEHEDPDLQEDPNKETLYNNNQGKSPLDRVDSRPNHFRGSGSSFHKQLSPRSRSQQQLPISLACVHHDEVFQFFCETCEEPICNSCTIVGPHNNQLHRINRMNDAYQSKCYAIQERVTKSLSNKRDQLLAQIHRNTEQKRFSMLRLQWREIFDQSLRVSQSDQEELRELNQLYYNIRYPNSRGKLIQQKKQRELDQINDIGQTFQQLSQNVDQAPFLLRSRYMFETIEHLIIKPFKTDISVYPYDLPRELTELRLQLQKANAQAKIIDQKNEVIWNLLNERKSLDKKLIEGTYDIQTSNIIKDMENQTNDEVNEWAVLVDKFQGELSRYQLMCCFCSVVLDPKIVNTPCTGNVQEVEVQTECIEDPPQHIFGRELHFFSKPLLQAI